LYASLVRWLLVVVVLGLAGPARAQSRPDLPNAPLRFDPATLDRAYKKAQNRRNVGIGLSVPGVAFAILGSVLIGYGANDRNLLGGGYEIASGSVVGGVGLALAIPGVVLWILGQDDMDVVTWRKQELREH
jgi:hypothetical protein